MDLSTLVREDRHYPRLTKILECLRVALDSAGGPERCYTGVALGTRQPILGLLDGKRNCGVAWVRRVSSFPYTTFPIPEEGAVLRGAPIAMQVEVGVARPMPRPVDRAMFADEQAMFETGELTASDELCMRKALSCCFDRTDLLWRDVQVSLGSYDPLPEDGGVAGGTWSAWIG